MSRFLHSIRFLEDVAPLKAGYVAEFDANLTFLVGDNGVGKSTILDCLMDHFGVEDDTYLKRRNLAKSVDISVAPGCKAVCLDLHGGDRKFAGAFGKNLGLQIQQMKASAGQSTLLQLLEAKPREIKDSLVLLDEPCRGLSIRNQIVVSRMIEMLVQNGNQVVAVTHSVIILESFSGKGKAQFFDVSKRHTVDYLSYFTEQCNW